MKRDRVVFATTESFSLCRLKSNLVLGIQRKKQQNVKNPDFFSKKSRTFYVLLLFLLNPGRNVSFQWAKTETFSCRKTTKLRPPRNIFGPPPKRPKVPTLRFQPLSSNQKRAVVGGNTHFQTIFGDGVLPETKCRRQKWSENSCSPLQQCAFGCSKAAEIVR